MTVPEANEILSRALEGGFFSAWAGEVWRRSVRDEVREAARALLGLGPREGLRVLIDVRARDAEQLRDGPPPGDWDQAKGAVLSRVLVERGTNPRTIPPR